MLKDLLLSLVAQKGAGQAQHLAAGGGSLLQDQHVEVQGAAPTLLRHEAQKVSLYIAMRRLTVRSCLGWQR